jgi:hypothetical protein
MDGNTKSEEPVIKDETTNKELTELIYDANTTINQIRDLSREIAEFPDIDSSSDDYVNFFQEHISDLYIKLEDLNNYKNVLNDTSIKIDNIMKLLKKSTE